MAFDLQSGYGLGAGADELQAQLRDLFARAVASQKLTQDQQRLDQEARRQAEEDAIRRESMRSLVDSRNFAQQQATDKAAEKAKADELAGAQANLRAGIQASENLAGTDNPTGALGTRNALRIALTSSGAKPNEIPQEPVDKPSKLYAVQVPGPNGQPVHKLVTEDEMKKGVTGYKAPAAPIVNFGGSQTPEQQVETAATAILEGRMAPSQAATMFGGFGKEGQAFKRAVMAKVQQVNPQFNFEQAESGYQFGKNTGTQTTVRMIDNISKTLPVLEKASDDFQRSGVRLVNKAILAGKNQIGDTNVATFQTARLGLADEIAKILSGGGTGNATSDAKLKQASDLLGSDMTPQQLRAVTGTVRELLQTRRDSLTSGTFMEKKGGGGADPLGIR